MLTVNQRAFLDMLSISEGTYGKGDNGYNMLVNPGGFFTSYADHPRVLVHVNAHLSSTAAGRYQLLARYFDSYQYSLDLPDFSPDSQDAIAIQQIKESKAEDDVINGDIKTAIQKCSHIWASLPGNGYGQHENTLEFLTEAYTKAGGVLAS